MLPKLVLTLGEQTSNSTNEIVLLFGEMTYLLTNNGIFAKLVTNYIHNIGIPTTLARLTGVHICIDML